MFSKVSSSAGGEKNTGESPRSSVGKNGEGEYRMLTKWRHTHADCGYAQIAQSKDLLSKKQLPLPQLPLDWGAMIE
jgi:hypothetical protein